MKIIVSLAVLVVAVNAIDKEFVEQMRTKMKSQIEDCAKEVSASSSDVAEIFSHKMPSTREGKCIFFCMHKIYNAQNDDGSLNMAGALENLELLKDIDADLHAKLHAAFKNCESTPPDADPCIFASNLVACVVKQKNELGIENVAIE